MGVHMKIQVPKLCGYKVGALVVQLTLFADGVLRVKPLVIFRGTGKHVILKEKLKYD